jgi:hypothetical protein
MIKVNLKVLSIPPYISTSWKNVASLHVEMDSSSLKIIILLQDGYRIEIPGLTPVTISQIFKTHCDYLEEENQATNLPTSSSLQFLSTLTEKLGNLFPLTAPTPEERFTPVIQHDPTQANSPDLPDYFLKKVANLIKILGIDDPYMLPKAEENCNCTHCQVAKALSSGFSEEKEISLLDEPVSDEDLKFRSWDIQDLGEKLYTVTNPLDASEQYNVYLGSPIGCTCGQAKCEHISAVLSN